MSERITSSEFARREGCTPAQITKAVSLGKLPRGEDGLIDASLVGTSWRKRYRTRAQTVADRAAELANLLGGTGAKVKPGETAADAAERATLQRAPFSRMEAERIKENYFACLRELEFQIKSGQVVDMEAATTEFFTAARMARDAWLNWPTRVAPLIAADLGLEADRVAEVLTAYVHAHITQLGDPDPEHLRSKAGTAAQGVG